MQRSFTYNHFIDYLIIFVAFIAYESLSNIYLFFPPLISLLLWYMIKYVRTEQMPGLILVVLMTLVYEVDKGYILFSVLIYFFLVIYFLLPRIEQYIICKSCIRFIIVLLAYVGLYIFASIFAQAFWLDMPAFTFAIFYYIIIEFFIVSLL